MDKQTETKNSESPRTLTIAHPRLGEKTFYYAPAVPLSQLRSTFEEKSELYLFSNYHFEHKGNILPEFQQLGSILEDNQKIDVVFTLFDYRAAKHHLSKVMEVIYDPEFYVYLTSSKDNSADEKENHYTNPIPKWATNDTILTLKPDISSEIFLGEGESNKKVDLLQSLSLSGFNPAPVSEKLSGDLFYIHCRTLEGHDLHITASVHGFYLNQSKISYFNPIKSSVNKNVHYNLIDLFKTISEKFRANFENYLAETKLTEAIKYKFLSQGYIHKKKWLDAVETDHGWNNRKVVLDPHIKNEINSIRDWNQNFQFGEEQTPFETEKKAFVNKVYSEFKSAAIEGACYLVDGKIPPLNPTDDKKKHIYIFNKIFFSIANETVYDHSQEKGEDATPSSSSVNTDLINIETLLNLNIPELHVLHMIVINYRGYKVIAQCIIPGILSVDQMNCSQYGSIDDGKTVETNPEFENIMVQVCEKLGLESKITVTDGEGNKKVIAGSPDIKGILGSDKRKYILDLLRISPRDLNYEGPANETCVIRGELLKKFYESKGKDAETLPKLNVNIGTEIKFQKDENYEAQQKLLREIASFLKNTAITKLIETFKTNPSGTLTDNAGISRAFHQHGVNLRYLGEVRNHSDLQNEKHIGLVLEKVIAVRSMKHLLRMAMRESNIMHLGMTIVNILNCLFGKKCHILLLDDQSLKHQVEGEHNQDKDQKRKKKKKGNKQGLNQVPEKQISMFVNVIKIPVNRFAHMRPKEIWSEVRKIASARYSFNLPEVQTAFEPFSFPFMKFSMLRDLCLSTGVVLERKNYDMIDGISLGNDKVLPFNIKNIASLEAIPKHLTFLPSNLAEREIESEKLIDKFHVKEALQLDSELERENLFLAGGTNEAAVRSLSRTGRIFYILGENKTAILQEEKNLHLLQSISCQDFYLNIQSNLNLGMYYMNASERERAIYHYLKATFLMLMSYGETAPDLLICLTNMARIHQQSKDFKQAIQCYEYAKEIFENLHGKFHVKNSICLSSLASISFEIGDLRKAIEYQTENVATLNKILPDTDTRLQDAMKILRFYRQIHQSKQTEKNFQLHMQIQQNQQKEENKKKKNGKKN